MDALIMAGGKGSRMGSSVPKPLIKFKNKALIEWVFHAVSDCRRVDRIITAISKDTSSVCDVIGTEFFMTPGRGYVEDLIHSVKKLRLDKTLIVSADIPLICTSDLEWVIEEYEKVDTPALSVYVRAELCRELKLSSGGEADALVPVGVNIIDGMNLDGDDTVLVTDKHSFAFNINTPDDLMKANNFV